MTSYEYLKLSKERGVAKVAMNRPQVHNAFDDGVVAELTRAFQELAEASDVRVIVLSGVGKTFCAGADLNWMRRMVDYTPEENIQDAKKMSAMYRTIDRSAKPVIARIQGAALGGGAGLAAVADIPIAASDAKFAFSEARLGIIPAVISPFVLARIGITHAREYFLSAERFSAQRAAEIGLVAHVVPAGELDQEVQRVAGEIFRSGPQAVSAAKKLLFKVCAETDAERITDLTSRAIAERRASDEGQEGMRAFLEKRPASWIHEA